MMVYYLIILENLIFLISFLFLLIFHCLVNFQYSILNLGVFIFSLRIKLLQLKEYIKNYLKLLQVLKELLVLHIFLLILFSLFSLKKFL